MENIFDALVDNAVMVREGVRANFLVMLAHSSSRSSRMSNRSRSRSRSRSSRGRSMGRRRGRSMSVRGRDRVEKTGLMTQATRKDETEETGKDRGGRLEARPNMNLGLAKRVIYSSLWNPGEEKVRLAQ